MLLDDPVSPFHLARSLVWWGLIVMAIATAFYVIVDASRADVGWIRRDLAVNVALLVVLLGVILDAASGFRVLNLRMAGWVAFVVATAHPLVADLPHRRRGSEPDGSPAPHYVPGACLAIDWALAALLLVGLFVLM